MTVVEFRRRRRRGAERKGTRMHGAIEGDLGLAGERSSQAPGSRNGQPSLEAETAARAEALGRRIREHREAFACSQQEFAQQSSISRATLSKIEQGHIYPSMRIRKKLAKALRVGPQELWNMRPEVLTDDSKKQAS